MDYVRKRLGLKKRINRFKKRSNFIVLFIGDFFDSSIKINSGINSPRKKK
jgi:hypothetical protein